MGGVQHTQIQDYVILCPGCPVPYAVYLFVVSHFGPLQGNRWPSALSLSQVMQLSGVEATVISFSVLVSASSTSSWRKAFSCLFEVIQSTMRPNVITFNAAISSCRSDECRRHGGSKKIRSPPGSVSCLVSYI